MRLEFVMRSLLEEIERTPSEMTARGPKIHEFMCRPSKPHKTSFVEHCTAGLLIRRKATIAAAIATHPYSSSITQTGSAPQGRPSVRKCHCTYTGMILTVQIMISSVEADVRNGSSQRRYHGKTTGAHKRDAAMGQANRSQANWSGDQSGAALLILCQAAAT